jgi:F-type H+-transporting ATPase subunit delta
VKRGDAIARRYARALFGLGDATTAAGLLEELARLSDAIVASDALRRVLFTPIHARPQRRAVIGELSTRLGLSPELRAFARILVDENRAQHLPSICDALRELVERAQGRIEAEVTSARELSAAEAAGIEEALSRRIGARVSLKTRVDPSLVAGVVARVGDLLLDGSLRSQIATLGENLRRGSA